MNNRPKILHSFIFSVFPVLFIYSHNISEVFLSQMLLPLGICLMSGILLWCIIFAFLRDALKSALLTSLIFIFFFAYGHAFSPIAGRYIGDLKIGIHTYALPVWTLIFAVSAVLVLRTKKDLCNFTKILNVISVCLVAISIGNIAIFQTKSLLQTPNIEVSQLPDDTPSVDPSKLENMPDIYYIILDEHARDDILEKELGYDSSPFLSHLKSNGFFVSENSRSNYTGTPISLASSLNFRYLDEIKDPYGHDSVNLIVNNRLFYFLKEIGYTTVTFTTCGYSNPMTADHDLMWKSTTSDFVKELINSTPLMSLEKLSSRTKYTHYKNVKYVFDEFSKTATLPSPHVVFAHILCPHEPYVFNEDGEFVRQAGGKGRKLQFSERKRKYLAQLKYVDKRITQIVDDILANSKKEPVIIIQADHGIRWPLWDASDESIDMSEINKAILNALYLPGFDYSKLDHDIAPVNTFRFVLNHYFDTEFEILENRN